MSIRLSFPITLLCLMVLCSFSTSIHAESKVVVLTTENFDEIVQDTSKHVFVKYYATWCGHCQRMAPAWETLAETFANSEDIIIAKIDASTESKVATKMGIRGFPTIRLYTKSDKSGKDYNGPREVVNLESFLQEHTDAQSI